jgi:ankyrin repeat protein
MDEHAALVEWSRKWFQYILDHPEKRWSYEGLSDNPNITWEVVQENQDKRWDYWKLSRNPNITWEIVQANPQKQWFYVYLSGNPNITWDIVQANPQKRWSYEGLSENPNITWEIVQANPQKPWDYDLLSKNPNITWEIVQANPRKPWDYSALSENPNITWEIVQANPDKPWNYMALSENPNITWEIVQANPNTEWDYDHLSANPNITWEIVQANPQKPWNYKELSANPNITWEIIQANQRKPWDYSYLSVNEMTKAREAFIRERMGGVGAAPAIDVNKQLLDAARDGKADVVRDMLARGADINSEDSNKDTALALASFKGHTQIVDLLIKAGADLNIQNNIKNTALALASFKGHTQIVDLLIKAGADINTQNNHNDTALTLASFKGHTEIVDLLIKAGADFIFDNYNALTFAAREGHVQIVNLLLKAGADVNARTPHDNTVLTLAAWKGHIQVVDLLLKAGADVNILTINKNTALMLAATYGHTQLVDLLLKAGADLNLQTIKKNTALILAAVNGYTQIVDLLLKAGADYTIKNNEGKTALDIAKTPEIRALIKSYMPKLLWKGFTQSDMDKFKTIFETEAPRGQKPPAVNYSCCPVCLAWVERSEACMYMKHKCTNEVGVSLYHYDLYNKFNEGGLIQWCTICGRICSNHKHYNISSPEDPKPALITPSAGADPFGDETACMAFGGGGLKEKLSRFRLLRKAALELQREVGTLDEEDAFNDLVESCWNAGDATRRRTANMAAKNFVETPSSAFPPNTIARAANNSPNVPAPNVLKPAGLAVTRVVEAEAGEMNMLGDEAAEGNPMLEITYEGGYKERVTQDTLKAAIQSRITSHWEPNFGYCLMYPECQARLYPSDVKEFVSVADYEEYRKRFNEKFRGAAVGGRRRHDGRRKTRKMRR